MVVKGGKETVLWLCAENNVDTSMVEVDGDLKKGVQIMADISQQERAVSSCSGVMSPSFGTYHVCLFVIAAK